jgi:hypothetical protein
MDGPDELNWRPLVSVYVQSLHSREPAWCATSSRSLDDLRWTHLQLCAKHPVPEAACNTKPILVVSKVVLEMVLLELLVVRR